MLRAGALLLAIFIAFIIGTLSSLILLRVYYFQFLRNSANAQEKRYRTMESAISIALSDTMTSTFIYTGSLDSNNTETYVHCRNWGIYRIATVKVKDQHDSLTRNFLSGKLPKGVFTSCLYLEDHNKPLRLVGNTALEGDIYIPKNGIMPGYIDTKGFSGKQLYTGKQMTSSGSLQTFIDKKIISAIENPSDSPQAENTNSQSFTGATKHIHYTTAAQLEGTYSGQLIIHSDSMIEVTSQCKLENVIISAPYIKVDDNFSGTLQLFATDSLVIGAHCTLSYPSAVVLIKRKSLESMPAVIRIKEHSAIHGAVISYVEDIKDQLRSLVWLHPEVRISGIFFVNGYASLNGTIHGTLLAENIILKKNSMIYDNYIENTVINRKILSSYYLAPTIFAIHPVQNEIIQWLN
jgi:hypothetical protein